MIKIKKMYKKIPFDFRQVFTFSMISSILTTFVSILLIRYLTVEAYATYTIFYSIGTFFVGILGHSIGMAYVRYTAEKISIDKKAKDYILMPAFIIVTLSSILAIIVANLIHDLINIKVSILMSAVFFGWLLSSQQLIVSYYQAREKYKISGLIINSRNLLVAILLFATLVIFNKNNIDLIINLYLVSGLIITFMAIFIIFKEEKLTFKNSNIELVNFAKASGWLVSYNVILQSFGQIDIQMLNIYSSAQDVAAYGVSVRYIAIMALLLPTLKTVLRVRMSKHEMVSSTDKQKEFAAKWIKKSTIPSLVITVLAIMASQFLFPIINGEEYGNSIVTFQIMAISMFFSYIFAPSSGLVMSLGKYKLQFLIALAALIIKVFGNFILIPSYGVVGAAITYGISYFLINCFFSIYILWPSKIKNT